MEEKDTNINERYVADLREFYEVDENGYRIEVHLIDINSGEEIPSNYFEGWGQRLFFNPRWSFEINDWIEEKKQEDILHVYKSNKDIELNVSCKESILSGFKHTIDGVEYHFSFDTEAQLNFQGARELLMNDEISEIMWTVRRDGEYTRIPINKSIMTELTVAILRHKESNIAKYRDFLMPLVQQATTVEEIDTIVW